MFRAALCLLTPAVGRRAPQCLSCHTAAFSMKGVGVVGAPFDKGQRRKGVGDGPRVIRETGVLERLSSLGLDIQDYGDVKDERGDSEVQQVELGSEVQQKVQLGPDGERNHNAVLEYNRRLSAAVASVVKDGRVCVTLGGDHSTAIGTINGHAAALPDQQVVVLWVDAHADLNTGSMSPSGNMHGMPVAHHLRDLAEQINRLPDGWPQPCTLMKKIGILSFGSREVERFGLQNVVTACLNHLRPSPTRPLHLSFDIDVLDPVEAPSTGTAVRAGLTLREGLAVCEAVYETGCLSALDLVEVNPSLGTEEGVTRTTTAARLVLLSALANCRTA